MPNTHRWILGSAIVLIVTLGFLSNALLLRTLDDLRGVRQQLSNEQTAAKISPMADDVMEEGDGPRSSLASFGQLVLPGQRATHFVELENGLALIGAEEPTADPATKRDLHIYLADMEKGTITHLLTRDLSGPGQTLSFETSYYDGVVRIRTLTQWEGYDNRYTDFFRMRDGKLLLTERYQNGQAIVLTRDGKSLDLSLAPKEACADNSSEPARSVNVTGLIANGKEVKFSKSYPVKCLPSEMLGAGFYPEIPESYYSGNLTAQGKDFFYLNLPVPIQATIDLNNLTDTGITLQEIRTQ